MITPGIMFSSPYTQNRPSKSGQSLLKSFSVGPKSLLMTLALGCTPGMAQPSATPPASLQPQPSHVNVQEIKSNKGITAWVVESHEIPVVSVALAFKNAGTVSDPKGLAGLAHLLSGMLDEGAGDMDSQEFKKFLLKNNIELNVTAAQDVFQINFRAVKKNVNEAFQMLRLMLTKPRFDENALDRVKKQLLTLYEQSLHNEHALGSQELNSVMYGDHPYGRTIQQILQEFPKVTDTQMRQFMKERFTRDQLLISVVGDITTGELKEYLDKTFGDFPEKAIPMDIKEPTLPKKGTTNIVPLNIPQSLVRFAQPGIFRKDPDFYAAFVLLKIIGDGQFESRLWDEIREKRGLAYEIEANLSWSEYAGLILGGTATKNANVKEAISLIRKVWGNMIEGATQNELDFVKKRVIGSFALNFSSTLKIAKALLVYQVDNLGLDFINKRNEMIAALTLDDINRVAKKLLNPEQLSFVICGEPKALSAQGLTQEKKSGASKQ